LSATVGATHLFATARSLEQALKMADAQPIPQAALADFRAVVHSTQEALRQVLALHTPSTPDPAPLPHPTPPTQEQQSALKNELFTLHQLLKCADMRAVDVHANLLQRYASHTTMDLDTLNRAVNTFDFSQGAAECEKLLASLT